VWHFFFRMKRKKISRAHSQKETKVFKIYCTSN
jgi:hypothetical protein